MTDTFSLELPRWLDWPRAVRLLDQQVRVPGEVVDVGGGVEQAEPGDAEATRPASPVEVEAAAKGVVAMFRDGNGPAG